MTFRKSIPHGNRFKDITDQTFGRLTVVETAEPKPNGDIQWLCRCICGNLPIVTGENLRSGNTRSCGCFQRERRTKHGLSKRPEYTIWENIVQRCTNPNNTAFASYGERGITLCPEWRESFEAFFWDMGKRPSPRHTVERVDNDKGYCLDNCVWDTRKKQQRNRRNNHLITFGDETLCLAEWAERCNVTYATLSGRLRKQPADVVLSNLLGI